MNTVGLVYWLFGLPHTYVAKFCFLSLQRSVLYDHHSSSFSVEFGESLGDSYSHFETASFVLENEL